MILYILIFLVIVALSNNTKSLLHQQQYFKYLMIFLAFFVGVSDMLGGYDRYIYGELFDRLADALHSDGGDIMSTQVVAYYHKEFGFVTWNYLIAHISSNRYVFILLTTLLIYFLFYRGLKKQTENPLFALVLFMALTFFFSFTYLRQMLAAGFVWQSLKYVEKRNLKMFCLWVFIAFSFHNSAIIFFFVYFIPLKKLDRKWMTWIVLGCLVLGLSGVPSALFDAYGDATDSAIRTGKYAEETGFRIAYLVEAIFFFYFIYKHYNTLGNNTRSVIGLNLSIIFCCVLLFFIKSENGGRLGWYFMIGLYSTFSTIFAGKKRVTNSNFIILTCLVLYIRILMIWGVLLYPYKSFFTNGIRKGDSIEMKYEYDHDYDYDKFYR